MSFQQYFEAYPEKSAGEYYPTRVPRSVVSALQRLRVKMFGHIVAGMDRLHFKKPTRIYLFKCQDCGAYNLDYLHGFFPNERLNCRPCLERSKGD